MISYKQKSIFLISLICSITLSCLASSQDVLSKEYAYIKAALDYLESDSLVRYIASIDSITIKDGKIPIELSKWHGFYRSGSVKSVLEQDYKIALDMENPENTPESWGIAKQVNDSIYQAGKGFRTPPGSQIKQSTLKKLYKKSRLVAFFSPIFKNKYMSCSLAIKFKYSPIETHETLDLLHDQGVNFVFLFKFDENGNIENVYPNIIQH